MEEQCIRIQNLSKSFSGRKVVDDLSLAVKKGEVELVAGVVLKNTLKAAALNGIVMKPKTGA